MEITRRNALAGVGTAVSLGLVGCTGRTEPPSDSTTESTTTASETVRAAFVYHDVVGDFGWQWAHEQGRRAVDSAFDWVETTVFEKSDPEGAARRFDQYAKRGFDVIFATSYDYGPAVREVAPDYPAVKFEHCSGTETGTNLGTYFGRMYEPRYLSGIAAGHLTDGGTIGYVAAYPISEVVRGINAFAQGVAAVDPAATVHVRYTGTWNDAAAESATAERLLEEGVDVMAQHQNYPTVAQTASEAGVWAFGYNSPMGQIVGENYVTAPIWNWEIFYRATVQSIHEGTWTSDFYWPGLESGLVALSEWGSNVPRSVINRVRSAREELIAGDRRVWAGTAFAGVSDQTLFSEVNQYVDTVAGTVPG